MGTRKLNTKKSLKRNRIGNSGEDSAVDFLKQNGYTVIARNYSSENGEIDIVSLKHGVLVFTEVKTNSDLRFGKAWIRVDSKKRSCMKRAVYDFLRFETKNGKVPYYRFGIRFTKKFKTTRCDIIEIYTSQSDGNTSINHEKNAFEFSRL